MSKGFKLTLWILLGMVAIAGAFYFYLSNSGYFKTAADVLAITAPRGNMPPIDNNLYSKIGPSVETKLATDITTTSVILNESITDQGTLPVIDRGFWLGLGINCSGAPIKVFGGAPTPPSNGPFSYSYNATGLTPATIYYFKAYAASDFGGNTYGACSSFRTLPSLLPWPSPSISVDPSVTAKPIVSVNPTPTILEQLSIKTKPASKVTSTSAVMNGMVTGGSATAREFELFNGPNCITSAHYTIGQNGGTGNYSQLIGISLTPGKTYSYYAQASNDTEDVKGACVGFKTLP